MGDVQRSGGGDDTGAQGAACGGGQRVRVRIGLSHPRDFPPRPRTQQRFAACRASAGLTGSRHTHQGDRRRHPLRMCRDHGCRRTADLATATPECRHVRAERRAGCPHGHSHSHSSATGERHRTDCTDELRDAYTERVGLGSHVSPQQDGGKSRFGSAQTRPDDTPLSTLTNGPAQKRPPIAALIETRSSTTIRP